MAGITALCKVFHPLKPIHGLTVEAHAIHHWAYTTRKWTVSQEFSPARTAVPDCCAGREIWFTLIAIVLIISRSNLKLKRESGYLKF
jgi:hypothetical protein